MRRLERRKRGTSAEHRDAWVALTVYPDVSLWATENREARCKKKGNQILFNTFSCWTIEISAMIYDSAEAGYCKKNFRSLSLFLTFFLGPSSWRVSISEISPSLTAKQQRDHSKISLNVSVADARARAENPWRSDGWCDERERKRGLTAS